MNKILATIFMLMSIRAFQLDETSISLLNVMLKPFGSSNSIDSITGSYAEFCRNFLYFEPAHPHDLQKLTMEMLEFNWENKAIQNLGEMTSERMIELLIQLLQTREHEILQNQYEGIKGDILTLAKNLLFRAVQLKEIEKLQKDHDLITLNKLGSSSAEKGQLMTISRSTLTTAIENFKAALNNRPIKVKQLVDLLDPELTSMYKRILPKYLDFVDFQTEPLKLFDNFLILTIQQIRDEQIKIGSHNHKTSMEKVIALIQIAANIEGEDTLSYGYISNFATNTILDLVLHQIKQQSFFLEVYNQILIMHTNKNSNQVSEQGKRLFLNLFMPKGYHEPNPEYIKLVYLKYVDQGIAKVSESDKRLSKMMSVYTIDLLHASTFHQYSLINSIDMDFVLSNMMVYYKTVNKIDFARFNLFRKMMMEYSTFFETYETIFISFYNFGLLWVNTSQRWDKYNQLSIGNLGMSLIDSLAYENWWFYALPDQKTFNINLKENYIAFVFITLESNMSYLRDNKIHFGTYNDVEDKNVEEFLFENERFVNTMTVIKEKYLSNDGFSFGVFNGVSLDNQFWSQMKKLYPARFEKKDVMSYI